MLSEDADGSVYAAKFSLGIASAFLNIKVLHVHFLKMSA